MAGHGSPPPGDRGTDPARQVTRDSGMREEVGEHMGVKTHIKEFRPMVGVTVERGQRVPKVSDRGTKFTWEIGERAEPGRSSDIFATGRGGGVRTLARARAATRSAAQRMMAGKDLYTGR